MKLSSELLQDEGTLRDRENERDREELVCLARWVLQCLPLPSFTLQLFLCSFLLPLFCLYVAECLQTVSALPAKKIYEHILACV